MLPNAPPTARSGSPRRQPRLPPSPAPAATWAVASSTTPTNVRPSPVLIAITSADFPKNSEAPSITTVATPSCPQRIPIFLQLPFPAEPVTPFHAANHPPRRIIHPTHPSSCPSPLSDLRALRGSDLTAPNVRATIPPCTRRRIPAAPGQTAPRSPIPLPFQKSQILPFAYQSRHKTDPPSTAPHIRNGTKWNTLATFSPPSPPNHPRQLRHTPRKRPPAHTNQPNHHVRRISAATRVPVTPICANLRAAWSTTPCPYTSTPTTPPAPRPPPRSSGGTTPASSRPTSPPPCATSWSAPASSTATRSTRRTHPRWAPAAPSTSPPSIPS